MSLVALTYRKLLADLYKASEEAGVFVYCEGELLPVLALGEAHEFHMDELLDETSLVLELGDDWEISGFFPSQLAGEVDTYHEAHLDETVRFVRTHDERVLLAERLATAGALGVDGQLPAEAMVIVAQEAEL